MRLGIYRQIADRNEVFCSELAACDTLSAATVSHHLRVLSRAGLISSRRRGQFIFYQAIPDRLAAYCSYLQERSDACSENVVNGHASSSKALSNI